MSDSGIELVYFFVAGSTTSVNGRDGTATSVFDFVAAFFGSLTNGTCP
jgi:hypothetical protein